MMKPSCLAALTLSGFALSFAAPAPSRGGEDTAADYRPRLFETLRLVYEDSFDGGELNFGFWEVRQNTTWALREGVLSGGPSPKEFQERKLAGDDPSHAGLKPVVWLKGVPEQFVFAARIRYLAENYQPKFPLIDLGHHVHTLTFSENAATLTIKKNVETLETATPRFSLNAWHDLVIELRRGKILLSIDGVEHLFESPHIDMAGQAQIDFKGVDFGGCEIDRVRLWEGK